MANKRVRDQRAKDGQGPGVYKTLTGKEMAFEHGPTQPRERVGDLPTEKAKAKRSEGDK